MPVDHVSGAAFSSTSCCYSKMHGLLGQGTASCRQYKVVSSGCCCLGINLPQQVALLTYGNCVCRYELLTRTADGNEGGRHQLLTAAVGNGNLYICKVQIGDKRWFKGES